MIALSDEARAQLTALNEYYAERGRDLAIDRLADSLERASFRIIHGRGSFYDAPRPYPTLARKGWRWTKEGRYWIAFTSGVRGLSIVAVFHDSADIPNRL